MLIKLNGTGQQRLWDAGPIEIVPLSFWRTSQRVGVSGKVQTENWQSLLGGRLEGC